MRIKLLFTAIVPFLVMGSLYAQDNAGSKNENPGSHFNSNRNILAVAPIQFTENGVGFAFSYEKVIDKDGIISYIMPVIATFNVNHSATNGNKQDAMFYFCPGLKFYPTSSYGRSKYAIGPSLVVGAGQRTEFTQYSTYLPGTGNYLTTEYYNTRSKFILGVMLDNSLNLNPAPHFYLGLNFSFGCTYINKLDGANQGINGVVQGGFKIGYRY